MLVEFDFGDDFACQSLIWLSFDPRDVDLAVGTTTEGIVEINYEAAVD